MKLRTLVAPALVVASGFAPRADAQSFDYAIQGVAQGDHEGAAISRIDDLDLDGCADFVIGAYDGHGGDGAVSIVSGKTGTEIDHFYGNANSGLGVSADGKIDVDLDGYNEILIGAPSDSSGASYAGRVVVYSPHLGKKIYDLTSTTPNEYFGGCVRSLQDDLDGDHVTDFIVGAWGGDNAYVYSGANSMLLFTKHGQFGSLYGVAVASGGNLDGDHIADFVVGSPYHADASGFLTGRVTAYAGKDGSKLWSVDGAHSSGFGFTLAHPGDLDGDGRGDVVVGAPLQKDMYLNNNGAAFLLSGVDGSTVYSLISSGVGDDFGSALRGAGGDVDGDGVNDFVVGAPQRDGSDVGYLQLVSGATGATLRTYTPNTSSPTGLTTYGYAADCGDVDGDGRVDVVIGGTDFDSQRGIVEVWRTIGATWSNYGAGWSGTNGVPSLTAREDPVIGRLLHVDVSDSAGNATLGLALVGASSASIATGKGGTLLVAPLLWVPVAIAAGGATLSGVIADDPALVGLHGFLQVLEVDAGASKGISFTPGLDLTIGFP